MVILELWSRTRILRVRTRGRGRSGATSPLGLEIRPRGRGQPCWRRRTAWVWRDLCWSSRDTVTLGRMFQEAPDHRGAPPTEFLQLSQWARSIYACSCPPPPRGGVTSLACGGAARGAVAPPHVQVGDKTSWTKSAVVGSLCCPERTNGTHVL